MQNPFFFSRVNKERLFSINTFRLLKSLLILKFTVCFFSCQCDTHLVKSRSHFVCFVISLYNQICSLCAHTMLRSQTYKCGYCKSTDWSITVRVGSQVYPHIMPLSREKPVTKIFLNQKQKNFLINK